MTLSLAPEERQMGHTNQLNANLFDNGQTRLRAFSREGTVAERGDARATGLSHGPAARTKAYGEPLPEIISLEGAWQRRDQIYIMVDGMTAPLG